ncbi:hypothetical protein FHY33_003615 [Xanthomonas arboricola]|nr:hypothetical protein [Xanthomonas campestris]
MSARTKSARRDQEGHGELEQQQHRTSRHGRVDILVVDEKRIQLVVQVLGEHVPI